jgi:hypothetical protein
VEHDLHPTNRIILLEPDDGINRSREPGGKFANEALGALPHVIRNHGVMRMKDDLHSLTS